LWLTVKGRRIGTTAEHPFYVVGKNAWVPAGEIEVGDEFVGHDGKITKLDGKESGEWSTVYNLRVADYHTYFVGAEDWGWSLWAHNTYAKLNASEKKLLKSLGKDPNDYISVLHRNTKTGEFHATIRGGEGATVKVSTDGVKPMKYGRELANKGGKYSGDSKAVTRKDGTNVKVGFTEDGFADFTPHTVRDANGKPIAVKIDMKGNHGSDYAAANKAAGFGATQDANPAGTTWHHSQDRKTMILVPSDIHGPVRHTGGVELVKRYGELPSANHKNVKFDLSNFN
jgi:hypothetical protein